MVTREAELQVYIKRKKVNKDTPDPAVINEAMLRKYIKQYNLEHHIFGMDSMPVSEILELRLSYQNLIAIQNLSDLHNLKKLCLDNNIISKIENLDDLSNLDWLDLSFNRIAVIEGLDNLGSLADLSLFSNKISDVGQGLDGCPKLNVLSIGDNLITGFEPMVGYLRKFKHLQVLNLSGNEICNDADFESYILAHMKYLKYLNYYIVSEQEVSKARDERRDELAEKDNALQQKENEAEEKTREDEFLQQLRNAFIDSTKNLSEMLWSEVEDDYDKVTALPDYNDYKVDYDSNILDSTTEYQAKILGDNEAKLKEISKFEKSLRKAEGRAETESLALIAEFNLKKNKAIRSLENDECTMEEVKAVRDLTYELEDKLMDIEVQLVERINEAIEDFSTTLTNIVKNINDKVVEYVSKLTKFSSDYFDKIQAVAREELDKFHAEGANQDSYSAKQQEVYKLKDTLGNAINSLREEHNSMLYQTEQTISAGYEVSRAEFISKISELQYLRNRNHIREIMDLAAEIRAELDALSQASYDDY
jgi:hypothetical protein